MKSILLVFCLFSFSNCSRTDPNFAIDQLVADGYKKETVSIADYTDFEWDRMFVFHPYTLESEIEQKLGRQSGSGIDFTDTFCLIAFRNEGKVVGFWEINRGTFDFCILSNKEGYSPSEAHFDLQRMAKNPKHVVEL